jgi:D-amino-acid dehydrogenase
LTEAQRSRSAVIIGAGFAGLAAAAHLVQRGVRVTLVDPAAPGQGASFGNAGCLSRASIVPVGLPGVWKKVPGYLMDPEGPFRIDWRYALRIAPWMIGLQRASRLERVNQIADALHPLLDPSVIEWRKLAAWAGVPELIRQDGYAFVYESEQAFLGDRLGRELRSARGVKIEILRGGEIREFDPALSPHLTHMTLMPQQGHVPNPGRLSAALAQALRAAGASFLEAKATGFDTEGGRVTAVQTTAGPLPADAVVIAAGAFSRPLAAQLGSDVPLETERGYHVMLPTAQGMPRIPVCSGEGKFFATPMETGLRVAGTVELAGLERPPDFTRADVLPRMAQRMLPEIDTAVTSRWMGHRPSLPDSLPVLGRSARYGNAFFDFGHGHVGLTAAPRCAAVIADLVCGQETDLDVAPYAATRFG